MESTTNHSISTQQERFYLIATKFLQAHTLNDTYKVICDEAMTLVGAKYASIFTPENNELHRVFATDPILYLVSPRKKGHVYDVFKRNEARIILPEKIAKNHPAFNRINVGNVIIAPLTYHNRSMGVISVLSQETQKFSPIQLKQIRYLAPLASLALQNALNIYRLEQSIEERNLFISVAAHELRSPLTAALGYTQFMMLLKKRHKDISLTHLNHLEAALNQLKALIGEFLAVDKIKQGLLTYTFKRWSLQRIMNTALENFKKRHPKRQVVFENGIKGNTWVKADRSKLIEVFTNVLNNAHKFSHINRPIKVTLENNPNFFGVNIIDQGIGISKRNLPHLFNKFYTTTDVSNQEGMGLGLFLAKSIIDKHHGGIKVASKINQGTTITVELPKFR